MMLILLLDSNARSYLPGHLLLERVELHPQVSEVGEPLRFIATRQKTIEKHAGGGGIIFFGGLGWDVGVWVWI